MYLLAADALLILHFGFVCFVTGGLAVIWLGYFLKWQCVYNLVFRIIHLLAIGVVILQALLGRHCPLTVWENKLRVLAGEGVVYQGSCIQYWVHKLMFFDVPPWVFTISYAVFFIVVCLTFIVVRPKRRNRS
jgi:hypothetical protein